MKQHDRRQKCNTTAELEVSPIASALPGQLLSPSPKLSDYVSFLDANTCRKDGSAPANDTTSSTRTELGLEQRMGERQFLRWGHQRLRHSSAGIEEAELLDLFDLLSRSTQLEDGLIGYEEYCLADTLFTAIDAGVYVQFAEQHVVQLFEALSPLGSNGPSYTDARLLFSVIGMDPHTVTKAMEDLKVETAEPIERSLFTQLMRHLCAEWEGHSSRESLDIGEDAALFVGQGMSDKEAKNRKKSSDPCFTCCCCSKQSKARRYR